MDFDPSLILNGDLKAFIEAIGYLGIFGMVFAESGMMVGFFFPGDSLLFTAGILASQGFFNIVLLVLGCFAFAVLGDSLGFYLGRRFGRRLFKKDSFFFNIKHLEKAEQFYQKHGGKTIILARFIPLIRAFAPVAAGIADMNYNKFLSFNIVGGLLWAVGVTLAGYYLGSTIPSIDKYLLPIIGLIILISVVPYLFHFKDKLSLVKIFRK